MTEVIEVKSIVHVSHIHGITLKIFSFLKNKFLVDTLPAFVIKSQIFFPTAKPWGTESWESDRKSIFLQQHALRPQYKPYTTAMNPMTTGCRKIALHTENLERESGNSVWK